MALKKHNPRLLMLLSLLLLASCNSGASSNGNGPATTPTSNGTTAPVVAGKSKLLGVGPTQISAAAHTVKISTAFGYFWPAPDGSSVLVGIPGKQQDYERFALVDLARDSTAAPITDTEFLVHSKQLQWKADGSAFAFQDQGSPLTSTIYIYDVQKASLVKVAVGSEVEATFQPVWSSSQDYLYFLAVRQQATYVMKTGRDGSGTKPLFSASDNPNIGVGFYGAMPGDKQFIFATADVSETFSLYLSDAAGANRQKLTEAQLVHNVSASPRGDAVLVEQVPAYVNVPQNLTYTLSTIVPLDPKLAGQSKKLPAPSVTPLAGKPFTAQSAMATWSPDGDKVAYLTISGAQNDNTVRGLWLANADGSQPTEVYSTTSQIAAVPTLTWARNDTITVTDGNGNLIVIQLTKM